MLRNEFRKRLHAALDKDVPPEVLSRVLSEGLNAYEEKRDYDENNITVKKRVPAWGTILSSVQMIVNIRGAEAPKETKDVTNVDDEQLSNKSIEELMQLGRGTSERIERLVGVVQENRGRDNKKEKTGASKK